MNNKNRLFTKSRLFSGIFIAAASSFLLAACQTPPMHSLQKSTAKRLAMPSFMHERHVETDPLVFTVYERVHEKGDVANIYIEGHDSNTRLNKDITPNNPVALHLAAFDNAPNTIYMALPCQYTQLTEDRDCSAGGQKAPYLYSETSIKAMNDVLSEIKDRYDLTGFNLIGFGGGAVPAVTLAAERDDVLTLRTVSGYLNTAPGAPEKDMENAGNNVNAVNPVQFAPLISDLPQHHFIGDRDNIITPDTYMAYYHATAPRKCIRFSIVEDANHMEGMVNAWPELLKMPVDCTREETPGTIIINKVEKAE